MTHYWRRLRLINTPKIRPLQGNDMAATSKTNQKQIDQWPFTVLKAYSKVHNFVFLLNDRLIDWRQNKELLKSFSFMWLFKKRKYFKIVKNIILCYTKAWYFFTHILFFWSYILINCQWFQVWMGVNYSKNACVKFFYSLMAYWFLKLSPLMNVNRAKQVLFTTGILTKDKSKWDILTSFWVLRSPESWSKNFFRAL